MKLSMQFLSLARINVNRKGKAILIMAKIANIRRFGRCDLGRDFSRIDVLLLAHVLPGYNRNYLCVIAKLGKHRLNSFEKMRCLL